MVIEFLTRAGGSRSGPMFMAGERAVFADAIAAEFIQRGVARQVIDEPPPVPTVDRPERERMVRKHEAVRK